jgi:hypothetical protein
VGIRAQIIRSGGRRLPSDRPIVGPRAGAVGGAPGRWLCTVSSVQSRRCATTMAHARKLETCAPTGKPTCNPGWSCCASDSAMASATTAGRQRAKPGLYDRSGFTFGLRLMNHLEPCVCPARVPTPPEARCGAGGSSPAGSHMAYRRVPARWACSDDHGPLGGRGPRHAALRGPHADTGRSTVQAPGWEEHMAFPAGSRACRPHHRCPRPATAGPTGE